MSKSERIKLFLLVVLCICLLPVLNIYANGTGKKKEAEVPVLTNFVGYDDINGVSQGDKDKVKAGIKKASDISGQSNVRFRGQSEQVVQTGNKDKNVDRKERDDLRATGPNEMKDLFGAGKGVKICIVDEINVVDVNTDPVGVAISGIAVLIIENINDLNEMATTIVHEYGHAVGELPDINTPGHVNNVMWWSTAGGNTIDVNDINNFFEGSKKRGKIVYGYVPMPLGGTASGSGQIGFDIDVHGAVLDGLKDVVCSAGGFDPCDPNFRYADLWETVLFCDNPNTPDSQTSISMQLGGPLPQVPFNAFYEIWINNDDDPNYNASIKMTIQDTGGGLTTEATYYNYDTSETLVLAAPTVRNNAEFDIGQPNEFVSASINMSVLTELITTDLASSAPIEIFIDVDANDSRLAEPIYDDTDVFEFDLTLNASDPMLTFVMLNERLGIVGSGFFDIGKVIIEIDSEEIDTAVVNSDGTFRFFFESGMQPEPGSHDVYVHHHPDFLLQPRAAGRWGSAELVLCEDGLADGDLDGDCTVDLIDFSIFADDWLHGKAGP